MIVSSHCSCSTCSSLCACNATFSYLMALIWLSFSSTVCWWSSFILFISCCQICLNTTLQQCFLKVFASVFDLKTPACTSFTHLCKYHIFANPLANPQVSPLWVHHSFDTSVVVFLTTMTFDNVCSFFLLYSSALHSSLKMSKASHWWSQHIIVLHLRQMA